LPPDRLGVGPKRHEDRSTAGSDPTPAWQSDPHNPDGGRRRCREIGGTSLRMPAASVPVERQPDGLKGEARTAGATELSWWQARVEGALWPVSFLGPSWVLLGSSQALTSTSRSPPRPARDALAIGMGAGCYRTSSSWFPRICRTTECGDSAAQCQFAREERI
jgi:hypothetical protein